MIQHPAHEHPRLGAPDLLAELLAGFPKLAPDWAEPSDGSARIRHQRIAALARAFGLGAPRAVVRGDFLEGASERGRVQVLQELAALQGVERPIEEGSARIVFAHLLAYRHDVERVVLASAGWLTCGDPALLGMIAAQNRIGGELTTMMADVDRWLCTLMDPAQRAFELRELITSHGWPDVDMGRLEDDEF